MHKISFLSIKIITFKIQLLKRRSSVSIAKDFLKIYIINRRVKP